MDRREEPGVLQSMGVTKSQTGLSNEHFHIIGWVLIQYDTCSYKKKIRPQKHTDGRLKEEKKAICKPWKEASEEINYVDSWISDFKIPEQWDNEFLSRDSVYGTLLGQS